MAPGAALTRLSRKALHAVNHGGFALACTLRNAFSPATLPEIAHWSLSELKSTARAFHLDPNVQSDRNLFFQTIRHTVPVQVDLRLTSRTLSQIACSGPEAYKEAVFSMRDRLQSGGQLAQLLHSHDQIDMQAYQKADAMVERIASRKIPSIFSKDPLITRMLLQFEKDKRGCSDVDADVLRRYIQDLLVKKDFYPLIKKTVDTMVSERVASGEYEALPIFPVAESTRFVLAGTAGSGKGYVTKMLMGSGQLNAEKSVKLIHDDFHEIMKKICNVARLTDMPASMLSDCLHEIVGDRIIDPAKADIAQAQEASGLSPNRVEEFIVVTDERIQSPHRVQVHVTVPAEISKVLEGTEARRRDTGRGVSPDYVINGQVGVSKTTPAAFESVLNGSSNTTIVMHDTAHIHDKTRGNKEIPVAICDATNQRSIIFSLDKFIKFNDMKRLDPTGHIPQTNDSEMAELFLHDYTKVLSSFVFIDPLVTAEQADESLVSHVYAHIESDTNELIIDNPEIYKRVIKESALTGAFFEELKAKKLEHQGAAELK